MRQNVSQISNDYFDLFVYVDRAGVVMIALNDGIAVVVVAGVQDDLR